MKKGYNAKDKKALKKVSKRIARQIAEHPEICMDYTGIESDDEEETTGEVSSFPNSTSTTIPSITSSPPMPASASNPHVMDVDKDSTNGYFVRLTTFITILLYIRIT